MYDKEVGVTLGCRMSKSRTLLSGLVVEVVVVSFLFRRGFLELELVFCRFVVFFALAGMDSLRIESKLFDA